METILVVYNRGQGTVAGNFLEDLANLDLAFKQKKSKYFINGSQHIIYTEDTRYIALSAYQNNLRGMRADYIYYDSTIPCEAKNYIESICVKQKGSLIKINLN